MLDEYLEIKKLYPKSLILIKSGNFYKCINDDAKVMNSIFEYKIIKLKKYSRVGFPIIKINHITGVLTNKQINYVIVDQHIIKKEKFNQNHYNEYIVNYDIVEEDYEKILNNKLALKKIEMINKELNNNINNSRIINILNEIERVICKINL